MCAAAYTCAHKSTRQHKKQHTKQKHKAKTRSKFNKIKMQQNQKIQQAKNTPSKKIE